MARIPIAAAHQESLADYAEQDVVILTIPVEDLAVGADIAERVAYEVPAEYAQGEVLSVRILAQGAAAGIDDANTSVWQVTKIGAGDIATRTYNTGTPFPAANAAGDVPLAATAHRNLFSGDRIGVAVTNGVAANPPAAVLVVRIRPHRIV